MTLKRRIARLEAASPVHGVEDGPLAALARTLPQALREARSLQVGLVRDPARAVADAGTEDRRDRG